MAGRQILPDVPRLIQLMEKPGMTHQKIADMFGVSRQAVTLKLKGATTSRTFRRDWPWDVQPRHKAGWLYDSISFWAVSRSKERPLTQRQQAQLAQFMDMLDQMGEQAGVDYVVDYYPDSAAGFLLRPRRAGDDPDSVLGTPSPRESVSA